MHWRIMPLAARVPQRNCSRHVRTSGSNAIRLHTGALLRWRRLLPAVATHSAPAPPSLRPLGKVSPYLQLARARWSSLQCRTDDGQPRNIGLTARPPARCLTPQCDAKVERSEARNYWMGIASRQASTAAPDMHELMDLRPNMCGKDSRWSTTFPEAHTSSKGAKGSRAPPPFP